MFETYPIDNIDKHKNKNLEINEKYPADIWTFAQVNLYNDYFITSPIKEEDSGELTDSSYGKKVDLSPERKLLNFHHKEFLNLETKKINLTNSERAKSKDKSMIIGSRYRFYVPLIDKNKNSSWVFYADPTMLFLNNPRTLIENLDPSKTVYVCKHDNYTTQRQTKTLIPSIKYPFANTLRDFFQQVNIADSDLNYIFKREFLTIKEIKKLFSPENFEKYDELFDKKNLSQDDFMKACLAIFKDKKNYMIRNKGIASEQMLEEIYQRWYVNDEMESFDNFDYDRKNWSSFMIFNKEKFNLKWQQLDSYSIEELHQFEWCDDKEIGEIPLSWNQLVDEQSDISNPNALNFTVDSPGRYNSTSTSKLNQKYININIAQCLFHYYETRKAETTDVNEKRLPVEQQKSLGDFSPPNDIEDGLVDYDFDLFVKPLLDLTPTKLKEYFKRIKIKDFSPLEVLYTETVPTNFEPMEVLDDAGNLNLEDYDRTYEELQEEADLSYGLRVKNNLINIEFYVQNYNDSKNKVLEMMKILQSQIKKLTKADKKEIYNLFMIYRDDSSTDLTELEKEIGHECFSIRELTGRVI